MNTETGSPPCCCFVCDFTTSAPEDIFTHASENHAVDIVKILSSNGVPDQLDYVKLVNFLRQNGKMLQKGLLTSNEWKDEKYLIPVLQNDPLLYFDVDELSCCTQMNENGNAEKMLKQKLEATEAELLEARATIEKMKAHVHKWLGENVASTTQPLLQNQEVAFAEPDDVDHGGEEEDDEDNEEGEPQTNTNSRGKNGHYDHQNGNKNRNSGAMEKIAPVDSSYFCSYAGYSVHKDMLQDTARTLAYLNFIKLNRKLFEGKVVIDVGCGTGILSMFAVRYGGARKVFALEPSNMAFQAMDTLAENGVPSDAITVINAPVESAEVARVLADFGEKADIIISEWMGYFMIFENMLPSVIFARDKFMRPDGFMAPSKADLFLDATDSMSAYKEFVGFWSDVYGFTMQKMKRRILMDAQLYVFEKSDIVSTAPSTIMSLDLNHCPPPPANFSVTCNMKFSKATSITAFVGWFTVDFEGGSSDSGNNSVCLSTAPGLLKTHWQQSALFLPEPVPVEQNENYPCLVSVSRCEFDHRSLTISITFKERTYRWALCRD